jgi:hypothetical protein
MDIAQLIQTILNEICEKGDDALNGFIFLGCWW